MSTLGNYIEKNITHTPSKTNPAVIPAESKKTTTPSNAPAETTLGKYIENKFVRPAPAAAPSPKKENTTLWKKAADKTKSWFTAPTEDTSQVVEKNPFTGKIEVTGFTSAQQKKYNEIVSEIDYLESVKGYVSTVEQADELQAQIDALSEEASGLRQSVGLEDKSFTSSERLEDWGNAWGNQFASAYVGAAGNVSELYTNRYDVGTDEKTYNALTPDQQAEYDRLMAQREQLEQSRAYVTTTEQSDELEAAFRANTEALQAIAPTDQSKAEALYSKSDELNREYQKSWNKATYGQSDAEIFLMQAGHQGLNIAADSLATIATIPLGGWGGKVSMAGRIYGQTASEARRQGDDVYTAAKKGITSAAIETISEMIGGGFDKVYGESLISGAVGKFVSNPIVKGAIDALGEGAEEGLASVMQLAADHMFGWSKSGNTFLEDIKANSGDMVYEMLLGTFVGVFGASGQIAIDSAREAEAIAAFAKVYGGSAEEIIQQGLDSKAGSKAYRMALNNQEKLAQNGKISDADLYKQFKANVEQIKAEGGDEEVWTPESAEPSAEAANAYFQQVRLKDAAEKAAWDEVRAKDTAKAPDVPNTEQPETPKAESPIVETPEAPKQEAPKAVTPKATKSKAIHESYADIESDNSSIESYAAKYESRAADVQNAYSEGQDVEEYGKAFDAAYRMGESMLPKRSLGKVQNLTDEQKQIAFQMGRDAAKERATARVRNIFGKGTGGRGVVSGEGISLADVRKKFNDAQNTAYRVLDKFARATGVNIVLYASDETGSREEGSFSWKDNTIRININSGVFSSGDVKDLSKYTALRTFSHELTHFTEKWNAEQYDSLREFVFEALDAKGVDVDERIQLRMAAGLSYDMASREVVADSMADMLGQSDIFERLAKKDANMAQSLLNKLKEFVARLKQAFKSMTTQNNYEAEILKDTIGYSEELVKKWTDALEGSIEAYKTKSEQPKKPKEKKPKEQPKKSENIKQQSYAGRSAKTADNSLRRQASLMEEMGEDSDTIREQTGWFRGMDGRWKYEIDDSEMQFSRSGFFSNPDVVRYKELESKMVQGLITEEEFAELQSLSKNLAGVRKTPKYLREYMKHDRLFAAYPELGDIEVKFADIGNVRGRYDPADNTITLNERLKKDDEMIKNVILHELQHGIQRIEGFAGGASVGYWQQRINEGYSEEVKAEAVAKADRAYKQMFNAAPNELKEKIREINREKLADNWDKVIELENEVYASEYAEQYMAIDDADFERRAAREKDYAVNAEDLYRNTAGEIEARDTVERRNLTGEQRKNTRPDVDREDVVFSERSGGFDEDIVQSSRGYWTPKLSQAEWGLLNRSLDREIGNPSKFLDDATKWLYAKERGNEVFSIYGIGDGTVPTPLYVSRGKKAGTDSLQLANYLKEEKYGDYHSGETFTSWTEAISTAKREYYADYDAHGQRGKALGLDNILGKLSERNRSGNTGRSTENSEGISQSDNVEQSARGRATLSDRELLEAAAERLPREGLTESEKLALVDFQKKLDKLKELQEQRAEQGRIYKEQMFTKGGNRAEAQKTKNRMDILDKKINSLENTILSMKDRDVFKKILKSARNMIEREARASEQKTLAEYRAKRNESEGQKKYRDRVIKTVRELMAWISTPSAKEGKRVPLELQEALSGLLSSIDFTSKRALKGGNPTKQDIDFKKKLQAVKDALDKNIKAVGAESGYVDIRPEFSDEYTNLLNKIESLIGEGEDYVINRMSSEDLKQLSELLKEVKHYIQNANTMHENEVFKTAHEAGDETIKSLGELGKASKHSELAGRFFTWYYNRPAYVFSYFGKGGESVYQEFRKAQGIQARLTKEVLDFSEQTFTPEMAKRWAETTRTFNIDGENVKIPITHIMSMYCLSKREQGLLHLLGGGFRVANFKNGKQTVSDVGHKITKEKLDEILATLDQFPAAKKVADELQKYMSTVCAAWGNEVDMVRFGVPKFLEKNYFPVNSDGRQLAATADEAPKEVSLYALLNAGFTKSLQIGANNRLIVYDIFDVFASHTNSMVQYRSFALPVLDALKWFNHKNGQGVTVRDAMSKAFGSKSEEKGSGGKSYAEDFVINLLKDYNGARQGSGKFDAVLLKGLSNINRTRVSFNLSTMLLQPTSIARAGMFIGGNKLLRGFGMAAKDYDALAAEMEKHSGIALWKSLGFYDVNVSRGVAEQIKQDMDWKQKFNELGMKGAEAADRFTWTAIWAASKASVNRAKYKTDAEYFEAVNTVFEEVIYKTQVVDSVLTKAEAQREKGFGAKSVMSFMSESVASTAVLSDAAIQYDLDSRRIGKAEAWKKNRKHIGRAVKVWTVSKVISAAMSALVAAWRDDDEYEEFGEKYFSALKEKLIEQLNPLSDLPLIGDVISMLQGYDDSSELGQIVSYFTSAWGIIGDKLDKDNDGDYEKYTWWGAMYKVLQGASAILGVPFATASRELVDLWNNTAGRLKPEWKLHTYDPGVQNSIKYAYLDGYISEEEAQQLLIEEGAIEAEDIEKAKSTAYWLVQDWQGIGKYDEIIEAVSTMNSSIYRTEFDHLISRGVREQDIYSKVTDYIKEGYLAGNISYSNAKASLEAYGGKEADDAEDIVNALDFELETGYEWDADGGFSNGVMRALEDGAISRQEAIEWYAKASSSTHGSLETAEEYVRVGEWRQSVAGAEAFNVSALEKWDKYGFHTTDAGLAKEDFVWAWKLYDNASAVYSNSGDRLKEKGDVFFEELYNRYMRGEISFWEMEALAHSFYSDSYYKRYKFW